MPQYPAKRAKSSPARRFIWTFMSLAALAACLALLSRTLFAITRIEVLGNNICSAQDVIDSSAIMLGDSIFSVSGERTRLSVNGNRYLEFAGVSCRYLPPCTVTLTVREHAPYAKLTWMGLLRVIGDHGVVLEKTPQVDLPIPVPEVVGMMINQAEVGREVIYTLPEQGNAIGSILDALYSAGIAGQVAQIHVATPNSLHLMTHGGMQIMLGNNERMREKMALVRDTLPYIEAMGGMSGRLLDVSTAVAADLRGPILTTPAPYAYANPSPAPTAEPEE